MENLRIYLTGRLAIETGQGPIADFTLWSGEDRLSFALLVLERSRPVALAEISDALWGDARPDDWQRRLEASIERLKPTVERLDTNEVALERSDDLVRLRLPPNVWVDMEHAHRSLEQAGAAMRDDDLDSVVTLSTTAAVIGKRPFLPGLESEWVVSKRAQHEAIRIDGLFLRAKGALRSGAVTKPYESPNRL